MPRAALPLAALLALAACRSPEAPPPAPSPSAPDEPAASEPADPSSRLVESMMRQVEARRRLPARSRVRSVTLDRPTMMAQVQRHSDEDIPREVLRSQAIIMQAMGWVPPGYDPEKGSLELLESQLAGYYDPALKTMFLARDLPPAEAEATLAHELVHALQDQHYDLGPRLKYRPESGDAPGSIQALAEGDATSAMLDVMLASVGKTALDLPERRMTEMMEAQVMGSVESVPPVLKAALIAPYIDGLRFVNSLRRRGGWAEVDRVWKNPPVTTEQLLHLDKYDLHEPPLAVPLPPLDALGGGFRVAFSDLMGEQTLRILLEQSASGREARDGAAGWGGDRMTLLSRSREGRDEWLVTWRIRFDGEHVRCPDAAEAFGLLRRGLLPQGAPPPEAQVCRDRPDLGPLAMAVSGCDVLMTAGPFSKNADNWRSESVCASVLPWLRGALKPPDR